VPLRYHWHPCPYREHRSHLAHHPLTTSFPIKATLAGAGYKVLSDLDGLTSADLSAGEGPRPPKRKLIIRIVPLDSTSRESPPLRCRSSNRNFHRGRCTRNISNITDQIVYSGRTTLIGIKTSILDTQSLPRSSNCPILAVIGIQHTQWYRGLKKVTPRDEERSNCTRDVCRDQWTTRSRQDGTRYCSCGEC
jgi:hypothetical protein